MTGSREPLGFDDYVAMHGRALQRFAFVLAGDADAARDLVQTALIKAYRHWRKISRMTAPHAYVRRILTRCFADAHRRRFRELPVADVPETIDPSDPAARAAEMDAITRALRTVPSRQRAVVVLRHYVGLTDDEIAAELDCSTATVRSHASHALRRLRDELSHPDMEARP